MGSRLPNPAARYPIKSTIMGLSACAEGQPALKDLTDVDVLQGTQR